MNTTAIEAELRSLENHSHFSYCAVFSLVWTWIQIVVWRSDCASESCHQTEAWLHLI